MKNVNPFFHCRVVVLSSTAPEGPLFVPFVRSAWIGRYSER